MKGSPRVTVKRTSTQHKPWAGRFRQSTDPKVEAFTSSLAVDRRLYAQDIQGSIAHCKTLGKARVLTASETKAIVRGLGSVKTELDRGRFRTAFPGPRSRFAVAAVRWWRAPGGRKAVGRRSEGVCRNQRHSLNSEPLQRTIEFGAKQRLRRRSEGALDLAWRSCTSILRGGQTGNRGPWGQPQGKLRNASSRDSRATGQYLNQEEEMSLTRVKMPLKGQG